MHVKVRNAYRNLFINLKEGSQLEYLYINERITRNWIQINNMGICELSSYSSVQGPVAASCEHVNELRVSLKAGYLPCSLLSASQEGLCSL